MKRMIILILSIILSGCSFDFSRNMQRANIRSVGDNTVTVSLDSIKDTEEAILVKDQIKTIAEAVRKFLYSGNISDLTIPELVMELEKIVPESYRSFVDFLISKIQVIHVNTQAIGPDNVRRIDAACIGVILACNEYRIEDRADYIGSNQSKARGLNYCLNGKCYIKGNVGFEVDKIPDEETMKKFNNSLTRRIR